MVTETSSAAQTGLKPRYGALGFKLPIFYRLFFLLIEPISALVGAYYAFFGQDEYLKLTHAGSKPSEIPLGTSVALSQLANLYLFFAINETLVLRSTTDLRVWKTVLFCLLIGDIGHLYTVYPLGLDIYWSVWRWNAIDAGSYLTRSPRKLRRHPRSTSS